MQIGNIKFILTIFILSVFLSGCSNSPYKNRSTDYIKVELKNYDLKGVNLAEDTMPVSGDIYPLNGEEKFVAPRPQPLSIKVNTQQVELRNKDGKKWLWSNSALASLWVNLYKFIERENLTINKVNARAGELFVNSSKGRLVFQARQGVIANTSEVYITGANQNIYLNKLYDFLNKDTNQSVSLVGMNLSNKTPSQIVLLPYPLLKLDFSLERSLLELDKVLSNSMNESDKRLEDKDFSKREFYIVFNEDKSEDDKVENYLYTIKLTGNSAKSEIRIFDRKGQKINSYKAEQILRFIQRQLQ